MITGNKGDWSEIYALFKLLGDTKLFAGDADLNKVEELFYPIIKIIRIETNGNFEYELLGDLVIISGGQETLRIPIQTFAEQAQSLLSEIKKSKGSAFSIPETEAFMTSIHCATLKAKSVSKTDIRIIIHDKKINQSAELGFSIKSQLGSDATLLNSNTSTNFIYQIMDFTPTDEEVKAINSIETRSKIKDRIEAILKNGGHLKFMTLEQPIFKNNLTLIDSLLPNIMSEMLKTFFTSRLSSIQDLTAHLTAVNPMDYDMQFSHPFYEYKIKRFLTDAALGMTSAKVWNGIYHATGGYLIVKESGDVLCYHIYDRNQFEAYLFANTKLETPSSTRHKFGKVYKDNGRFYFKLNLQIRFK